MPHVIPNKRDQLRVVVSERAYRRIVGYSFRYANAKIKSANWREVYGILVGFIDHSSNDIVRVADAIPMVVGERAGVKFEAKQYVDLASIDATVYAKTTQRGLAEMICGWWHSHPGFGFFYSEVDTRTHLGYQMSNPHAVGLVFDHTQMSSYDCGLECLKLDNLEDLLGAGHSFLVYEVENFESLLQSAVPWADRLQDKLRGAESHLQDIDSPLWKKQFAQLQQNYGLRLVPKQVAGEENPETPGESEDQWVWDEKSLEPKFRIPNFRKNLERMLESAKRAPNPRGLVANLQEQLQRPQLQFAEIVKAFWEHMNEIASGYPYFDTNERQVIETFDRQLREYGRILNDFSARASEVMNHVGDSLDVGKPKPAAQVAAGHKTDPKTRLKELEKQVKDAQKAGDLTAVAVAYFEIAKLHDTLGNKKAADKARKAQLEATKKGLGTVRNVLAAEAEQEAGTGDYAKAAKLYAKCKKISADLYKGGDLKEKENVEIFARKQEEMEHKAKE